MPAIVRAMGFMPAFIVLMMAVRVIMDNAATEQENGKQANGGDELFHNHFLLFYQAFLLGEHGMQR
ncbi:hypothetical protein B4923_17165 [Brenneria roseae subsp. americana]|uniref:Uncharacterized protein n=1 Tax=Brenneria roseae subsp. americana TaxID=1508507 RepID=A0A2U1TL86_9GAMM|nr:hypothetical protein [Brenneria roseae]PWC10161.1 hypothetical protein B4923_17165 [Brenneria roseae subsp. americana]